MMSQLVAGLGDLRLPAIAPQYRRGDREACAAVARCDGDACAFVCVWLRHKEMASPKSCGLCGDASDGAGAGPAASARVRDDCVDKTRL